MPGKVNPVMAECLDMVAFQVVWERFDNCFPCGSSRTIGTQCHDASYHVQYALLYSNSKQLYSSIHEEVRKGIIVNEKQCSQSLEKNPSLATLLSPYIGYLEAAKIAKQAQAENRSVKEIALEKRLLKPEK